MNTSIYVSEKFAKGWKKKVWQKLCHRWQGNISSPSLHPSSVLDIMEKWLTLQCTVTDIVQAFQGFFVRMMGCKAVGKSWKANGSPNSVWRIKKNRRTHSCHRGWYNQFQKHSFLKSSASYRSRIFSLFASKMQTGLRSSVSWGPAFLQWNHAALWHDYVRQNCIKNRHCKTNCRRIAGSTCAVISALWQMVCLLKD
mgnify:FL=1